jgi:biopolymer transport protein ExbB
MVTTVAGLIVGIIALFGYNLLVAKVDKVAHRLENACEKFIESLY